MVILLGAIILAVKWIVQLFKFWTGIPFTLSVLDLTALYAFALLGMIDFILPKFKDFLGEVSTIKNSRKTYSKE
jgi:hypothetical protein